MKTYAILRRSGWRSGAELGEAAARSRLVGDEQTRALLPVDEIVQVADCVIVRPDPGPVGA